MTGTIITGTYLTGVTLNNPSTENPATIAASGTVSITSSSGQAALYGLAGTTWTISNLGTIAGLGAFSFGINLRSGGEVTNGSITATRALIDGLVGIGSAGTVTNFATIKDGIDLSGGGQVINGSSAATKALIEGAPVSIFGGGGTVINFGTLEAVAPDSNGIGLFSGGRVTNGSSKSTTALIRGAGAGIAVGSATGTIINYGTIESIGPGTTVRFNAGIELVDGSRIDNLGTIQDMSTIDGTGVFMQDAGSVSNGSSSTTSALIVGYTNGIYAGPAHPATITNFGTIETTATNATNTSAIWLSDGGVVTNGSTAARAALISSAGNRAISMGGTAGGTGTVTNFGTILTTGTAITPLAPAIYLGGGGTITNYGLVKGAVPSTGGPQGVITTHNAAIRNFGTILSTHGNNAINLDHGGTVINGSASDKTR